MLAFQTKIIQLQGAAKARSASGRPHEQAAKRLRMVGAEQILFSVIQFLHMTTHEFA